MIDYASLNGEDISPADLLITKAIEAYSVIIEANYFEFIFALRLKNGDEVLVFDVEVERGQRVINDIRYVERIAIEFNDKDSHIPYVYALRIDFPQVSHLNLRPFEIPKCLCLYDVPYEELKVNWRSIELLQRIREWLKLTALNILHQDDQPLEPLLINDAGNLILPHNIKPGDDIFIYGASQHGIKVNLIGYLKKIDNAKELNFKLLYLKGEIPKTHGIITQSPTNLLELIQFLIRAQIDLLSELKNKILKSLTTQEYNKKILICIFIPKKRTNSSTEIFYDSYAFILNNSFLEIGKVLDLITIHEGIPVKNMIPVIALEKLIEVELDLLKPHLSFNRESAQIFNNINPENGDVTMFQIGVGALGSHIFMNLSRMGVGKWTLVDDDVILPHNLARHTANAAGQLKAESVSLQANKLLNDSLHSKAYITNFFIGIENEAFQADLIKADFILDISTSIAVERKLANMQDIIGRRISLFLNPTGDDLVILAEGVSKDFAIDELEMQYYRVLISEPKLDSHLNQKVGSVRYANSCRDISSRISQDIIALHSAIASNAIKKLINSNDPIIKIGRVTNDDYNVEVNNYKIYSVQRNIKAGWTIVVDNFIIDKLNSHRNSRLPKETGGVLIGNVDQLNQKIYIVDSILSPLDSHEYPYAYYRGILGIQDKLKQVENITAGNLYYIGEWHSHPQGCSLEKSSDDIILFEWIVKHMKSIGFPALMAIFGDYRSFKLHFKPL